MYFSSEISPRKAQSRTRAALIDAAHNFLQSREIFPQSNSEHDSLHRSTSKFVDLVYTQYADEHEENRVS